MRFRLYITTAYNYACMQSNLVSRWGLRRGLQDHTYLYGV